MAHAWLDSLSEDWVSQPGSDSSQAQLPSFSQSQSQSQTNSQHQISRDSISRIPRPSIVGKKPAADGGHEDSPLPLSERSSNEINIRGSRRGPSKLSQEIKSLERGRHMSRSISVSTTASVVHNTMQHKSLSASPTKGRDSIPEWKRRLVYGELAYGETKDLFSSAAAQGLGNIFRPLAPPKSPQNEEQDDIDEAADEYTINDTTLPSSPPPYSRPTRRSQIDGSERDFSSQSHQESHSKPVKQRISYKRMDESVSNRSGEFDASERPSTEDDATVPLQMDQSSFAFASDRSDLDASRKISGQSVIRNEDLSPIILSRHDSGDGKVSFAPIDLPAEQLRKRLEKLRRNQMLLDSEPGSVLDEGAGIFIDRSQKFDTTEDYVRNGGFLNLQRGGRSAEDSFRDRPLSPPLNMESSEMLPESSLQASTPKQFPTIRLEKFTLAARGGATGSPPSPVQPRAPNPSPEKRFPPAQTSGASPLKLFGPYDTFTNQTLLRRISQFEDQMTGPSSPVGEKHIAGAAQDVQDSILRSEFRVFETDSLPRKAKQVSHGHHETFAAMNRFGEGKLDGYLFSEEVSISSSEGAEATNKENEAPEWEDSALSAPSLKFDLGQQSPPSEEEVLQIRRSRHKYSKSAESAYPQPGAFPGQDEEALTTPKRDGSEGKRPRTSPSKDPTPKRRRTLHKSDIAYGLEDPASALIQSSHHIQYMVGDKRKDARQGDGLETADASIMAARHVLRPRVPTPSQRQSATQGRAPLGELLPDSDDHEADGSTVLDGSHMLMRDNVIDGSRKTSIKTQDFLDEAEKIMAMIRNKARPPNSLSSVEESDVESAQNTEEIGDSFQESTKEPFSRPPSRDGRPVSRMPTRQDDPDLVDRLKQYEERSEMGDIISYSMRSIGLAQDAIQEVNKINESVQESLRISGMRHAFSSDGEIISDLANVRLSRNPDADLTAKDIQETEFPSNGSQRTGRSGGSSIPTGSSRSDSRRLIGPDVVTQLIGDQVGNMVLDKQKNIWVKMKTPKPVPRHQNILPSEDSEEDPFASIPDLTVDMTREVQNLHLAASQNRQDLEEFVQEDELSQAGTDAYENSMADGLSELSEESLMRARKKTHEAAAEDDGAVEHEISIQEDRDRNSSPSRRRNLTITFSSPIASIIQDILPESSSSSHGDEGNLSQAGLPVSDTGSNSLGRGRNVKVNGSDSIKSAKSRSRSRPRSHGSLSVRGPAFIPRPVSRIDEQDEDTAVDEDYADMRQVSIRADSSIVAVEDEKRRASVSIVVTPAPTRTLPPTSATPIIGQYVGTLSLSPLSEFTMNHGDQSCALEVSYVVGDQYLMTGDGSRKVLSQTIRKLVEKITEVEPFEPDWEGLQELEINGKQLTSLHKLDEFCTGLVTLDASQNLIDHLEGVPASVRNLRITHNHLSGLTAWGHLANLQYVDISNNDITSLYAFKDLVHLRSLRADNNQITSLEGIKFHDGLQVLRVRNNLIKDIDFDGTNLCRLTELDLENNQISSVRNIDQLPALSSLNLDHNCMTSFNTTADTKMTSLKYLNISDNDIVSLDVSQFPSIRLLHADRNRLIELNGCSKARRLDSLSLREQRGDSPLGLAFLSSAYEVRKLYLSGNLMAAFDPAIDFLNLQYLELANCGLASLPATLGQLMPNLRTLNLNFNAIEDLSPLRYIPRLKKLLVAGNRLADAGALANVLGEFPHLGVLDARDNPVTLGFYPPVQTLVPTKETEDKRATGPFVLAGATKERDEAFSSRLDMGTRMRRRLYEMVVTGHCQRLRTLDGLGVDRDTAAKKDEIWNKLVEAGLVACPRRQDAAGAEARRESTESTEGGGEDGGRTDALNDGEAASS